MIADIAIRLAVGSIGFLMACVVIMLLGCLFYYLKEKIKPHRLVVALFWGAVTIKVIYDLGGAIVEYLK